MNDMMSSIPAIAYGRKSFDDPDRRTSSVEDQRAAAASYAERTGMTVVNFFGDNGITGATMERPGLQAMLKAIAHGEAKIVIIEDVDRLGRDQEHLQHMLKIFRVHDVILHTVSAGVIDELTFSFKGIIGEQQRKRIAYTTRRGLKSKAGRGGGTGGKTLGYAREVVGHEGNGIVDRLVIVEEEAALVRRIFELYADGRSLKQICHILDQDGIPPIRAREGGKYKPETWNPSTLSGSIELGEGILNNETYIGRRVFNRRTWIEIPNDKRGFTRQPRLNPERDWVISSSPVIVSQDLWDRVKVRQREARAARDAKFKITGNPLAGAKRPRHLLSELVECGTCAKPFLATGGGRWRCKGHRSHGCTNGSVSTVELEARVLGGVRERLLSPEVVRQFAAALQLELEAAHQDADAGRELILDELTETQKRIGKMVQRIEEDDDAPRALVQRLKDLEATESRLTAELRSIPEAAVVRLPANYEAVYARAITELDIHLGADEGAVAREAVRALIEKIVVQPGDGRGGKPRPIQLHGDLFEMLAFASAAGSAVDTKKLPRTNLSDGVVIPLVAGTGFEPVTFRL